MAYLYGASIKGIQGYIFASSELKEIIGASEIIKGIESRVKHDQFKEDYNLNEKPTVLLAAAGNIRLVIDNKDDAKKIVKHFIKDIMQSAYGITAAQALIEIDNNEDKTIKAKRALLEQKINEQRNKAVLPLDKHINILKLDAKSSRPQYDKKVYDEYRNISTFQKLSKYDSSIKEKTDYKELSELSNQNGKIAVIHADGNGLGEFVKNYAGSISDFSKSLEDATYTAFDRASEVLETKGIKKREVILGGDDLTLICDAGYALEFTQHYLKFFEEETAKIGGAENGLTACAGIAYCHEKFPLHYVLALAEELCGYAKKHAKQINPTLAPSCLMFHNTQESEFSSYEKITEDVIARTGVSFAFGPYYIGEQTLGTVEQPTIDELVALYQAMASNEGVMNAYREAVDEFYEDKASLERVLGDLNEKITDDTFSDNLNSLFGGLVPSKLIVQKDGIDKTPIIDIFELKNVEGVASYEM